MNKLSEIAVVGMSCIFPGAKDLDAYWHNITHKVNALTTAPEHRIAGLHFDPGSNDIDKHYTNKGGFIDDYLDFDPIAYGIVPNTIPETEPEQFLSLKLSHLALKDAGVFEKNIPLERSGIVIGKGNYGGTVSMKLIETVAGVHHLKNILGTVRPDFSQRDLERISKAYQDELGHFGPHNAIGNTPSLVAALVANRFNFSGPAYTVDAACASSLIAVDHCVKELQLGRSDLMIAGAIHIAQTPMLWSVFCTLGAFSRTNTVRPFDKKADGVLAGEGCGFLVLRRLEDAIKDDQRIYATIKGVGISSDGSHASLMSPAWQGQTKAIKQAWDQTSLTYDQIGYIEAHGTATVLGDKTELKTLSTYFPNTSGMPLAGIGSVKSMIGHAMPASGMAGFIKTALALHHGTLPPTLHCDDPHEDMKNTRFEAVQNPIEWSQTDLPMIAGVNAFGFGGANSHVILEKFNNTKKRYAQKHAINHHIDIDTVLYLARASAKDLIKALENEDNEEGEGDYRIALFNPTTARRQKAIKIINIDKPWKGKQDIWFTKAPLLMNDAKIAFVFPGLDSIGLESLSKSDYKGLAETFDIPISPLLENPPKKGVEILSALDESFRVMYQALRKIGLTPDLVTGHSMGEWAACSAIGLIDTLGIEAIEADVINNTYSKPDYVYLTACCSIEKVKDLIANGTVYLSNHNCPNQLVLSCSESKLESLRGILIKRQIINFVLPVNSGYHSPSGSVYEASVRHNVSEYFDISRSSIPVWSCITAQQYPKTNTEVEALHVDFLTNTVQFDQLIHNLYAHNVRMFIQVGAGATTGFINDILKHKAYATVSAGNKDKTAKTQLKRVFAALFIEGRTLDSKVLEKEIENKTPLPKKKGMRVMLDIGYKKVDPKNIFTAADLNPKTFTTPSLEKPSATNTLHPMVQGFNDVMTEIVKSQTEVLNVLTHKNLKNNIPQKIAEGKIATVTNTAIDSFEKSFERKDFEEELDLSVRKYPFLMDHIPAQKRSRTTTFTDDLEPVVPLTMFIDLCHELVTRRLAKSGFSIAAMQNIVIKQFMYSLPNTLTKASVKGQWVNNTKLHLSIAGYIDMDLIISENYTPPKEVHVISENKKIPILAAEVYDNLYLFHGKSYQGLERLDRYDATGMATTIQAKEGKGSLLDAALQSVALWHHFEEKNLVGFPVGIKEILFHSDPSDQQGVFSVTTSHQKENEEFLIDDLSILKNESLWCSIHGIKMKKAEFKFDFFKLIQDQEGELLATIIAPGIALMERKYRRMNTWNLIMKSYLTQSEKIVYDNLFIGKQIPWFLGRISVKDAIRSYLKTTTDVICHPGLLAITNDEKGKPELSQSVTTKPLHISIAHKKDIGVGTCSDIPVGIDIELIKDRPTSFMQEMLNLDEITLYQTHGEGSELLTRMWVAKEAYGKQLGLGLQGHPKQYHIEAIEADRLRIKNIWIKTITYKNTYIIGWTQN